MIFHNKIGAKVGIMLVILGFYERLGLKLDFAVMQGEIRLRNSVGRSLDKVRR